MAAPPYQKFFWGSYHKHTAHLNHGREHGAYILLIGALWNNDGRLPADDDILSSYAKLSLEEWVQVKPKLMPLFKVTRGKLTQKRVTEDLAKYRDTSGKRKEAGKAGGNARAGKQRENRTAIAAGLHTQSEPESEPKKEREANASLSSSDDAKAKAKRKVVVYPAEFDLAWKAYPHVDGRSSKPNALAQWKALSDEERDGLVVGIGKFRPKVATVCGDRGAPCMARWLRDGKHLNWLSEANDAARPVAFEGPPKLRDEVVDLLGEGFAVNYIDPARWLPGGRVLIAHNTYAAGRIRKDLADWLVSRRVNVEVAGTPSLSPAEAAA